MHSCTIYFYFAFSLSYSSAYFLGGTIHWMSLPSPEHAILFTYRLAWQKSTGPCGARCDESIIGNQGDVTNPPLSNLTWQCSINCGSRWGPWDINYFLTSVSRRSDGWEQGEGSFQHIFNDTGPFKVWLKYFPWIPSGRSPVSEIGYMHTVVDLRKRNDINRINSSPYVSLQSIMGVQLNCPTVIQLPVYDPDGDIVRCRWSDPQECDNACTNVPNNTVILNKVNCSIIINAYSFLGYSSNVTYRLTIMVEDFPKKNITLGYDAKSKETNLSSIPVQLTLRIIDTNHECRNIMKFVRPTPRPARMSYTNYNILNSTLVKIGFYLETEDKNTTDFLVSAPEYANYTIFDDEATYGRPNVTQIEIKWIPKLSQIGDYQVCVWGIDQYGLTSGARCVTAIVQDDYGCPHHNGSCHGNGECINLYQNEACQCKSGFKPPTCANASRCLDSPCYHNATCSDTGNVYYCHCAEGYTGHNCEYEIDACDIKPCLNGGTCISLQKDYRCVCPTDFSGKLCEERALFIVSSPSSTSLSSTTHIFTSTAVAVSKENTHTTVYVTVSSSLFSLHTSTYISAAKERNNTTFAISKPTVTTYAMYSTPSPSTKLSTASAIINLTGLTPALFKSASQILTSSSTDSVSKTAFTTVTKHEYRGDRKHGIIKIVAGVLGGLGGLGILGACLWMVKHRPCRNKNIDEERSRKPSSERMNAGQTKKTVMTPERQTVQETRVWKNNRVDPDLENSTPPPKFRKPDIARVRKESSVDLLG